MRLLLEVNSSEAYAIKLGEPVIIQEDRFEAPPFMKDAGVVALVNGPILRPGKRAYGASSRSTTPSPATSTRTTSSSCAPTPSCWAW